MKKLLLVAVALLGIASAAHAGPPITNGVLTNPAVNAILVDTGPLDGPQNHTYQFFVSSSVAAVIVVENRDSANATNVWAHTFPIAAMSPFVLKIDSFTLNGSTERIRIRLNAAITGLIQASAVVD